MTVDLAASVVPHNVLNVVAIGYGGTGPARPFRLNGHRLVIGDGNTLAQALERLDH